MEDKEAQGFRTHKHMGPRNVLHLGKTLCKLINVYAYDPVEIQWQGEYLIMRRAPDQVCFFCGEREKNEEGIKLVQYKERCICENCLEDLKGNNYGKRLPSHARSYAEQIEAKKRRIDNIQKWNRRQSNTKWNRRQQDDMQRDDKCAVLGSTDEVKGTEPD